MAVYCAGLWFGQCCYCLVSAVGGKFEMTKKHFIALAHAIKEHNASKQAVWGHNSGRMCFSEEEIRTLADFCATQNPRFDRVRRLRYIAGECGPNGGKI
jgi:hypothetical protein